MYKIILTFIFFFVLSLPSYSDSDLQIMLSPNKVSQGKSFVVELISNENNNLGKLKIRFNNKNINFFQIEENKYRAYIGVAGDIKPNLYNLDVINENNEKIQNISINILSGSFYTENIIFKMPYLTKEEKRIIAQEDKWIQKAKNSISNICLWQSSFISPVNNRVSSVYGTRRYLNNQAIKYHAGIDFASPFGTEVKAINNAKVVLAKYLSKKNSNGNIIILDHGQGVTSAYLHLSKIKVKEGDLINKGDVIGLVGNTGLSTAAHLHWSVYLNGQDIDGLSWIKYTQD